MNELVEKFDHCPYCDERISILIDTSIPEQSYIEDCMVCCRPITIKVNIEEFSISHMQLLQENDSPG